MTRRKPVGSIRWPSEYGRGGAEGPKFIQCMDVREPQIHEVWDFGSDIITREVHLTARVYVGTGVVGEFASNCLTESGVGYLFLVEFPLMEVLNIWAFIDSTEPVGPFGLPIFWIPFLVGETVVPPPIITGEFNLGYLMEVLLSLGVVPSLFCYRWNYFHV